MKSGNGKSFQATYATACIPNQERSCVGKLTVTEVSREVLRPERVYAGQPLAWQQK